MSELDDIAAAAGIVIIDTAAPGDGGDADAQWGDDKAVDSVGINGDNQESYEREGKATLPEIVALEAMFSNRYTKDDPDYAQVVSDADVLSSPPFVNNYRARRSRDDYRNRGGRGGWGGGRGGGRGGWGGGRGGWDRDRDRGHYDNRSYRGSRDDYRSGYHHRDGGDGRDNYRDRNRDRNW